MRELGLETEKKEMSYFTSGKFRVQQRSLDLEQFCHETATRLCAWADKKFWFCNDYDVEVGDV